MRCLTNQQWQKLYEGVWKPHHLHLTKEQRRWYVRQCFGKIGFESKAEAYQHTKYLPPIEGKILGYYTCELCKFVHSGNSSRKYERYQRLGGVPTPADRNAQGTLPADEENTDAAS